MNRRMLLFRYINLYPYCLPDGYTRSEGFVKLFTQRETSQEGYGRKASRLVRCGWVVEWLVS